MKVLMVLTSHDQLGNITGQNPASSTGTAQALLELLWAQKAA